jgi:transposase
MAKGRRGATALHKKVRRRGHITKRGSSELRGMLCECAHHAARRCHLLNPYWVRVCSQQGYRRAVIAVATLFTPMLVLEKHLWRDSMELTA